MPTEPIIGPTARRVVAVTGSDRLSYLHAVTSQDVEGLAAGTVTASLYLDAHGAPLLAFEVVTLDERLLLVAPDEDGATQLVEILGGRTFLSDATFQLTGYEVQALRGADAHEVASAAHLDVTAGHARQAGDCWLAGREQGLDVIGEPEALRAVTDRLVAAGAAAVDEATLDQWRIDAGVPAWGTEIVAPHLPEELGLLPTHVHLDKGCYPGQEAVARMWMLGRPRRRLAALELDDGVDVGWQTGSGRRRVEVTSATTYGGRRRGLGFVPTDASPGDRFGDEVGVTVRSFVGDGHPVPGHDPAVPRRRDRR